MAATVEHIAPWRYLGRVEYDEQIRKDFTPVDKKPQQPRDTQQR